MKIGVVRNIGRQYSAACLLHNKKRKSCGVRTFSKKSKALHIFHYLLGKGVDERFAHRDALDRFGIDVYQFLR